MNFNGANFGGGPRLLLNPFGGGSGQVASPDTSTSITTEQKQVAVQGGNAVGSDNSGQTTSGGAIVTGSGNHISVESSDPQTVAAALSFAGGVAGNASQVALQAVNGSQTDTLAALSAVQQLTETSQAANVQLAQLQAVAGQPVVGSAAGSSIFPQVNTTNLIVGFIVLLVALIFLARRK